MSAASAGPVSDQQDQPSAPADFNETAYLAAFPKIAENVRKGVVKSALDHYLLKGVAEKRLEQPRYRKALAEQSLLARLSGPVPAPSSPTKAAPSAKPAASSKPARSSERPAPPKSAAFPEVLPAGDHPQPPAPLVRGYVASGLDALLVAQGGFCLAIGWVDDRGCEMSTVSLRLPNGRYVPSTSIARCRRTDAEAAIGCPPGTLLGFYALVELGQDAPPGAGTLVELHCGGEPIGHAAQPHLLDPAALRDSTFEYLAAATYFGTPSVESYFQLQAGVGDPLLQLNLALSGRISSQAYVERHGPHNRKFRGSIVVCLFGKLEYFFLQAAAFSAAPGAADYEYVYVCNSPELTEALQREARIAARLYGLSYTLVLLTGNAGFGAANNTAVSHAASDRVLIVNPDVFPRNPDWARRHAELVDTLPQAQTQLFGAPLFYDDGSLMHGGMFIDVDDGLSIKPDGITRQQLLRVEHYGKGAPPEMAQFRGSRRVPAVTGAFMSADRPWFERLGGFSGEYVFGHYEDADLCLKAWRAGGEVWMHDLPLWHLEGKGSTRRAAHEGGSLINRWHFTRTWLATVHDGFAGPAPARLAA